MVDRIVTLGREEVVNAIKDTEWVMYRRGVWNSYSKRKTDEVAKIVMEKYEISISSLRLHYEFGGAFSSDNSLFTCALMGTEKEGSDILNFF